MFYPRLISEFDGKTWLSEASLESNCKTSLGREAKKASTQTIKELKVPSLLGHLRIRILFDCILLYTKNLHYNTVDMVKYFRWWYNWYIDT